MGNEGKPIMNASPELKRALTGMKFERGMTIKKNPIDLKGDAMSSIEGSFYQLQESIA